MDLRATLEELKTRALGELKRLEAFGRLEEWRQEFLGRKGELAEALRRLGEAVEAERPRIGELANQVKRELEHAFTAAEQAWASRGQATSVPERFDPTLPGLHFGGFASSGGGRLHPLSQVRYRLEDVAERLGLAVLEGPELESEHYNFTALNIPPGHPARDIQDTFWVKVGVRSGQLLLRTQTSAQQVRTLRRYGAPFGGVFPGRVFRNEATDARHEQTFDQLEGLVVDRSVSVADMLGVLRSLLNQFFGREVPVRVRPGYFPFVEPGLELDGGCVCGGREAHCKLCGGSGWLELLGCGLVHPKVLEAGGLNPAEWSGFAFGIGVTRLAMLEFGIDDVRLLLANDWRFLRQF